MKAILFDLDGTLLPLDFEQFLEAYIRSISLYCKSISYPEQFAKALLQSTDKMLDNDGGQTNEDVFMAHFLPALGMKKEEVYPLLASFYAKEFTKLQTYARPTGLAAEIVRAALGQGWKIILATNAVFPKMAIEERMRWSGVDGFPWDLITSYEDSHACKPKLAYYQEILERLGLVAEDCWMIGNDWYEDMVAARLGFKTYLVTGCEIGKRREDLQPKAYGTMSELLEFVQAGMLSGE